MNFVIQVQDQNSFSSTLNNLTKNLIISEKIQSLAPIKDAISFIQYGAKALVHDDFFDCFDGLSGTQSQASVLVSQKS